MFCHCKDPEKPRVLLLEPTRISTSNIGGTTIHSGLGFKPGAKLFDLNGKSKSTLRNRLTKVMFLIINELVVISSDLRTDIDTRLDKYLMMIPEKKFAGLSVMTVAELLQPPPVKGRLIYSQFSDKDNMKYVLSL